MSVPTAEHQTHSIRSGASPCAELPAGPQAPEETHTRIAILAHDLKNPLAVIRGRAQMMHRRMEQANMPDRDDIEEALGHIEDAAERMTVLLDELIHVWVPTRSSDHFKPPRTDLAAMARALAADFQHTSDRHRLRVQVPAREIVGRWQPAHVERIISNLLANAIKYSPRGGEIALSVWDEVDPRDRTRWAVVRISDQGIGIPSDELPRVFELRHRASNAYGTAQGGGFGLAAVRELVAEYQGAVTVESQEGRGSSFTVRLPLEPPPANPDPPSRGAGCMLHIEEEERHLLTRLLQAAVREVRRELSVTDTDEVRAFIKPREVLLRGLLERVRTAAGTL